VQTRWVADRLKKNRPDLDIETVIIKTRGDIMQDVSLARIGGKGVFVKEIEEALLNNAIDLAVHSMKDMPAELPEGLTVAAMPEREDPRDVLVSRDRRKLEELPKGARLGTGSLRRGLQVRSLLPDIEIVPLRGNLDTRIKKIDTENLDGVILAAAGLRRMGWVGRASQFIPTEILLPAVGQGVLGIEIREDDEELKNILAPLQHPATWIAVGSERAFLQRLGGGCQLPIAAYGKIEQKILKLRALVGSPDGRFIVRDEITGPPEEFAALGTVLADKILVQGGEAILNEIRKETI
jgi:hydroxymethylbilane synthase